MAHFTDPTSLVFTLYCTTGHTFSPRNLLNLINMRPKEDATSARGFKQHFRNSGLWFWDVLKASFWWDNKNFMRLKLYLEEQTTVGLRPVGEELVSVLQRADVEGHPRPEESRLGPLSPHCPKEMNIYEHCDLNKRDKINSRCHLWPRRLLLKDWRARSASHLTPH